MSVDPLLASTSQKTSTDWDQLCAFFFSNIRTFVDETQNIGIWKKYFTAVYTQKTPEPYFKHMIIECIRGAAMKRANSGVNWGPEGPGKRTPTAPLLPLTISPPPTPSPPLLSPLHLLSPSRSTRPLPSRLRVRINSVPQLHSSAE